MVYRKDRATLPDSSVFFYLFLIQKLLKPEKAPRQLGAIGEKFINLNRFTSRKAQEPAGALSGIGLRLLPEETANRI